MTIATQFSAVAGGHVAKPFPAKFKGECPRCKQAIAVGDPIKSRTEVDPWVHSACTFVLAPKDKKNVDEWTRGLLDRGFNGGHASGPAVVWELRDEQRDECIAMAWWGATGEGWPEYHMAVAGGALFKTLHPASALTIFDALTTYQDTTEDEFEAYRQKLLEKLT